MGDIKRRSDSLQAFCPYDMLGRTQRDDKFSVDDSKAKARLRILACRDTFCLSTSLRWRPGTMLIGSDSACSRTPLVTSRANARLFSKKRDRQAGRQTRHDYLLYAIDTIIVCDQVDA